MTHFLNIVFILSLLFTVTVGASGVDLGAPTCHTGTATWNKHDRSNNHHTPRYQAPRLKIACTCDCPCCSYVTHLIPLAPPAIVARPAAPEAGYPELAVISVSHVIAPLTHPPNT